MSEPTPLDLRALADVDSPEVVHAALRAFRRRLWTRYLWIALVIALAAVSFVAGTRPSDLRERMREASLRAFPSATWRIEGSTIALAEVADLGETTGLRFVVVPDPGVTLSGVAVQLSLGVFADGTYDTYIEVPKSGEGRVIFIVGPRGCIPGCSTGQTDTIVDLGALGVPDRTWRDDG